MTTNSRPSRIRIKSLPDGRRHTEVMVRRADPIAVIWAEAPPALRFLTQNWQFIGPERTADGVAYHRPGCVPRWALGMEQGVRVHHDAHAGRPRWDATPGESRRAVCGRWPRPAPPLRGLARCMSYVSALASTRQRWAHPLHPLTQAIQTLCSRRAAACTRGRRALSIRARARCSRVRCSWDMTMTTQYASAA